MRNKLKIFAALILFMLVALAIGLPLHFQFNDGYNHAPEYPGEYKLDIRNDSSLIAKDGRLYDATYDSFVADKIPFRVEAVKRDEDYTLVYYKNNNDNPLALVGVNQYNNLDRIMFVDNKTGISYDFIARSSFVEKLRIDFDEIYKLDKKTYIIPYYDLLSSDISNVMLFHIYNDNGYPRALKLDYFGIPLGEKIVSYAIEGNKMILSYSNSSVEILELSCNVEIRENELIINRNNMFKNIDATYKDKELLFDGYYSTLNKKIIYLDSKLNVRYFSNEEIIDCLDSKDEFIEKYII